MQAWFALVINYNKHISERLKKDLKLRAYQTMHEEHE